jgi:hypothetical protein
MARLPAEGTNRNDFNAVGIIGMHGWDGGSYVFDFRVGQSFGERQGSLRATSYKTPPSRRVLSLYLLFIINRRAVEPAPQCSSALK